MSPKRKQGDSSPPLRFGDGVGERGLGRGGWGDGVGGMGWGGWGWGRGLGGGVHRFLPLSASGSGPGGGVHRFLPLSASGSGRGEGLSSSPLRFGEGAGGRGSSLPLSPLRGGGRGEGFFASSPSPLRGGGPGGRGSFLASDVRCPPIHKPPPAPPAARGIRPRQPVRVPLGIALEGTGRVALVHAMDQQPVGPVRGQFVLVEISCTSRGSFR